MTSIKKYDGLEIAIIGMSGRFPQSDNHRQFWQHLRQGQELLKTYTDEELRQLGVPESSLQDSRYVKTVGVVDDKDCFDAGFFGYGIPEATLMDPQTRLFHEQCWAALEDGGYTAQLDKQRVGLYAGASVNDNWKLYAYSQAAAVGMKPFLVSMIASHTFLTTLVSYKLNLRGPSVFIDTACSTSLTAVQLACRSLLTRDCSLALAGGVSIKTQVTKGYFHEEGMIASRDGHCRTFDAAASGTASGEGVGVVLLKRLSEALKDGDNVYAVIRAAVINNDGNLKVGYTAPSVKGQADCVRLAQRLASIDPRSITYLEAHGTATKIGDPVEIRALNEAFGVGGAEKYCAIGSVKSNLGHLDAAAGVAGLLKAALCLKYRQLPASLHFKKPNPEIDFEGGPFYVNTSLQAWIPRGDFPLRAGLSSLGMGGTNAHLILEEAPEPETSVSARRHLLLTVSGKTAGALSRNMEALHQFLRTEEEVNLADMAYTLQVGRKHFAHRQAFVFQTRQELAALLSAAVPLAQGSEPANKVVFLFPGAGSQYVNMGKDLYEAEPVFREELDRGFALLRELTGDDYHALFYPAQPGEYRLNKVLHSQPAIFLFEYALARLVLSYGLKPDYMLGHSIGEYAAACLSGVFTFEDALRLIVRRGQLVDSLPEGAMLSVALAEEAIQQYLDEQVSLAVVNGPDQVVVAGSLPAIHALSARLEAADIASTLLHATYAAHSFLLDPILAQYRAEVLAVARQAPQLPFVSCLTGNLITAEECQSADYWVRHMRETMRFSAGLATLLAAPEAVVFVEVGAGNALTSLLRQQPPAPARFTALNLVRHPKETDHDARYLLGRLGQLWARGIPLDWLAAYRHERRRRVSLPTYSFEPIRFPTEVDPLASGLLASSVGQRPGTPQGLANWLYYPTWKRVEHGGAPVLGAAESFLFFSPGEEVGRSLAAALTTAGHTVVEVLAGESYQQLTPSCYVLNPAQPDHFAWLLLALQAQGRVATTMLYAWALAASPLRSLQADGHTFNLAYLGLAHAMQAVAQQPSLTLKSVAVLTQRLHQVLGTEDGAYAQALVLGLVRVIPQEYGIPCVNIDLDDAPAGSLQVVLHELGRPAAGSTGQVVAVRHGKRWVEDFEKHQPHVLPQGPACRAGGTYLLTGGLGNVGYTLAQHLLAHYGATVILLGRRELAESPAPTQQKWQQLQQLGGHVSYWCLDVVDAEGLERLVAELEASGGRVDGVIHAAGVTDDRYYELIDDITPAKSLVMFGAKVMGLESLYAVFKNRNPDFVWLTSSLATVLGGLSFAAYASANAYMNQFVVARAAELPRWKCAVLGGILFEEKSLAAEDDGNRSGLRAAEVVELFEWNLAASSLPLVVQCTGDIWARRQEASKGRPAALPAATPEAPQPRLERPTLATRYVAPTTETEHKLQALFGEFFGIMDIGVEDLFFDLGGDSLKGMMLLKRIKQAFNVQLPLRDFLGNATIRFIAARLDELAAEAAEEKKPELRIEPVAPQASYPVAASQFRLWLLSQVPESSVAYNMPGMYEFEGELDRPALAHAFEALIERHESLRTVFREDEQGAVKQYILAPAALNFSIAYHDMRAVADWPAWMQQQMPTLFGQPFDLAAGPLLQAGLYQVEDHKWLFTYVMHHIISDGWSMGIVMKELMLLYGAFCAGLANPLPPLRIQYKDYVAWQQTQLTGATLEKHKAYWLQQLAGKLPVLDLPGSHQRPAFKTYQGDAVAKVIGAALGREFRALVHGYGGTMFMGLLAAVNVLLHRYADQEDIIVGTPILGREHLDLEDQVGFYLNTLALRTQLTADDSYRTVLARTQQTTLGAFEHQIFPFDQLLEELQVPRDASRNPLFDVMLILQNTQGSNPLPAQGDGRLRIRSYHGRQTLASKFDLTFDFVEAGDELHLKLVFNRDLFHRSTVVQLAGYLERLLAAIVAQPQAPIRQFEYLSPAEREQLAALQLEFNATVSDEF